MLGKVTMCDGISLVNKKMLMIIQSSIVRAGRVPPPRSE